MGFPTPNFAFLDDNFIRTSISDSFPTAKYSVWTVPLLLIVTLVTMLLTATWGNNGT